MTQAYEVKHAARRLLVRCTAHLIARYPHGDYESDPYYKVELRDLMCILNDIGHKGHPFGAYLIRNGWADKKYENVGIDIYTRVCHFLVNGSTDKRQGKLATQSYLDNLDRDPNIEAEHLALHETIGTYIKKVKPGIERVYYSMD